MRRSLLLSRLACRGRRLGCWGAVGEWGDLPLLLIRQLPSSPPQGLLSSLSAVGVLSRATNRWKTQALGSLCDLGQVPSQACFPSGTTGRRTRGDRVAWMISTFLSASMASSRMGWWFLQG